MDYSALLAALRENDAVRLRLFLESAEFVSDGDGPWCTPTLLDCLTAGDDDNDEREGGEEVDARKRDILEILVQHGADVNVDIKMEEFCDLVLPGKSAVMFAAERGFLKCVQFLDASGADLSAVCVTGETALHFAVKQKRFQCVKYLAKRMAPSALNSKDEDGMTALMLATFLPREESCFLYVQHLIACGADLNAEDAKGRTALMFALRFSLPAVVYLLLDSGAAYGNVAPDGFAPLTVAFGRMHSNLGCIIKLLEKGEDPTLSRRNLAIVHRAVCWNEKALIRSLVMNGHPPLNMPSETFRLLEPCERSQLSPLAMAFLCKTPEVANYFIANRFFTYSDVVSLHQDAYIRKSLLVPSVLSLKPKFTLL
ncbi:ankyrin repeat protein [Elysia marginata]|uniref:Ankyrin repeat protein n=1 Tax=Elysia marginata TaxID=1093978 RepID=A0AAV4HSA1_9GAST|nr:ankyrin repeat protein [Elysia marginata]